MLTSYATHFFLVVLLMIIVVVMITVMVTGMKKARLVLKILMVCLPSPRSVHKIDSSVLE